LKKAPEKKAPDEVNLKKKKAPDEVNLKKNKTINPKSSEKLIFMEF